MYDFTVDNGCDYIVDNKYELIDVINHLNETIGINIDYVALRKGDTELEDIFHNGKFTISITDTYVGNTSVETHFSHSDLGNMMLISTAFNVAAMDAGSDYRILII